MECAGVENNMGVVYVIGDATDPGGNDNRIIVHVCNDIGGWGRGFVLALSARWPAAESAYLQWHASRQHNDFGLGAVQLVAVSESIWVANLVGQRDVVAGPDGPPVRYNAIEQGLHSVAAEALERTASVHMPRIGSGLAGGDWPVIESIVERTLLAAGVSVTVYDLS